MSTFYALLTLSNFLCAGLDFAAGAYGWAAFNGLAGLVTLRAFIEVES